LSRDYIVPGFRICDFKDLHHRQTPGGRNDKQIDQQFLGKPKREGRVVARELPSEQARVDTVFIRRSKITLRIPRDRPALAAEARRRRLPRNRSFR
jgi:hypothetical protein